MFKPTLFAVSVALTGLLFAGQAAAESCSAPPGSEAQIQVVLAQTNAQRQAKGLPALRLSSTLNASAQAHACAMVATDNFSHRGAGGTLPKARARKAGCRSSLVAENIAMGFTSGSKIMDMWIASSGHKRNILLRGVNSIGIAVAAPKAGQKGGPRWVQVFARGC